jgi:flavin reductase (DIM6/NTAB) family NADH-FMN oxidoreductase RutF
MIDAESKDLTHNQCWNYLLGAVAPRPIALVSTTSEDGINNLSPFSFFNAFGANPPVVAFSASRRGRDNTVKDTYNNIISTGECVINIVTYSMVHQVNLASCEYDNDTDEFIKSGLTAIESDLVKPKRVMESPVQMECRLLQMVELGGKAGSGNLAICEVIKFHISEEILVNDEIEPSLIDHVGRNGKEYYTRAFGASMFTIPKPGRIKGIGIDNLPDFVKESSIFTANNLGRLALVNDIPSVIDSKSFVKSFTLTDSSVHSFERYELSGNYQKMMSSALSMIKKGTGSINLLERVAKVAIENDNVDFAWKTILYLGSLKERKD